MGRLDRFFLRHELVIVLALTILAGIRVLIYSAAFPVFGYVDETAHYSLVVDYAQGHIPAGLEGHNAEASRVIGWHYSPEYLTRKENVDRGLMRPPLELVPRRVAKAFAERTILQHINQLNHESNQPPVYYTLAAGAYKVGQALGIANAHLVHWTRLLGPLAAGLLVWFAWVFLRRLYPNSLTLRAGVPLMLAFYPQDLFYAVNNDVLTPLLFTIAFYALLRLYQEPHRSYGFYAGVGLSAAAVFLNKFSNATIFLPMAVILLLILKKARASGQLRLALPRVGVAVAAAGLPIAAWLTRNYLVMGRLSGEHEKMKFLGWTYKPLGAIFDHPVFTAGGAWRFVHELISSFWRGEMAWFRIPIALPAADYFYTISTLLFIGAAVVLLLRRRHQQPDDQALAGWMGVLVFATSVGMMFVLSIIFDFGGCYYPSREYPYLVSGRLFSGVIVPFLVLYITGLDYLMARARLKISRLSVLMVIAFLITVSEAVISVPVFVSPWNWFHI